mmetsp:Transcript_32141/g.39490  ORF Transcript_32141/g.39490 Transcript_32141/m.39490 type:complete len:123 (+) Transcript_32141:28-396(+)
MTLNLIKMTTNNENSDHNITCQPCNLSVNINSNDIKSNNNNCNHNNNQSSFGLTLSVTNLEYDVSADDCNIEYDIDGNDCNDWLNIFMNETKVQESRTSITSIESGSPNFKPKPVISLHKKK